MATIETMKAWRAAALKATEAGPPVRTSNPFFGVGPITDATRDEADSRLLRFEFENWLEANYRKLDDKGNALGPFTAAEIGRSMHRGYPADKVLADMMREIHRYFAFPKSTRLAVGLGGGHSGFTVCVMHMMNANDQSQHVFIDTPKPESEAAKAGGFFRQSWGAQMIELQRFAPKGDENRLHFADAEGTIPSANQLSAMGIKLFIGVGHETTGATTYTEQDVRNLLAWIDSDPANHHAVIDATSMLGAMPWAPELAAEFTAKVSMFMPFQKAIGGISGYYVAALTKHAIALIEANQKDPAWAIPRQLKIVVPVDAKRPLSGERTVNLGPIYDPETGKMLGGIINTYSTLAFAETTFGLLRAEKRIGSVAEMNKRSIENREAINVWTSKNPLIELGVAEPARRGAAVTLLRVNDPDCDPALHERIIARSKQLLDYQGLTHPDGSREPGLDVARYVNAFPGTPGDYRAWIGGIRPAPDVPALLENLKYAYLRAKIVVIEEELAKQGEVVKAEIPARSDAAPTRKDDATRAYKVLIADLIGLNFGKDGKPDHSEVKAFVAAEGGTFHDGALDPKAKLAPGIHFFYQPHLSTEAELMAAAGDGQYDALIAAATFIPKDAKFAEGGVRIGAGTGNMGSASWGGGNGGGSAPLMNTPSFNSRATAQMAMKALLKVRPGIDVDTMHKRVVAGDFDTGRQLRDFPTEKLEGKTMAVIGYGNIGREVAKLARAFGMIVKVHARPRHREWIEAEGFIYAATPEDAAKDADVLSPHVGLGSFDAEKKLWSNAGSVGASVLNALKPGAVLINYDRGEIVDCAALDAALASGRVAYAAIDADLFKDEKSGALSGPMVPYLAVEKKHPGKLELLPHAAADTEHVSRVEGAKQAVRQIMSAIRHKVVINAKGPVPAGYTSGGPRTVAGVGATSKATIARALSDEKALAEACASAETLAALWGAFASITDADRRSELVDRYSGDLLKAFNRHTALMRKLGIEGPLG